MTGLRRTVLAIPQAGVAVTEGTLVRWLVAEGDRVEEGQPIYVLETEKVEMEVESPAAGTVHRVGQEGVTYPVGADVGSVEAQGPDVASGAGTPPES